MNMNLAEKKAVAPEQHIRRTPLSYVASGINYLVLTLLGFITLYPFWYCLILSFNTGKDALRGGIYFWPREWTFSNYLKAFQNPLIVSSFVVSVTRTGLLVVIGCLMTALMAYALTKKSLPGRTAIIFYFYFTTIFSGGIIPTYIMYRQIGLLNNYWVLVLPSIYSFFNALILRTFFNSIPESVQESARIDGASETMIFFRIMLPLSVPVIATVALFIGVGAWNDWFAGAYYLSKRHDLYPAATLLYDLMNQAVFETNPEVAGATTSNASLIAGMAAATTPESLKMAFLIILTVPIICVYPFLQKYFVTGIMVGSIKE